MMPERILKKLARRFARHGWITVVLTEAEFDAMFQLIVEGRTRD